MGVPKYTLNGHNVENNIVKLEVVIQLYIVPTIPRHEDMTAC